MAKIKPFCIFETSSTHNCIETSNFHNCIELTIMITNVDYTKQEHAHTNKLYLFEIVYSTHIFANFRFT